MQVKSNLKTLVSEKKIIKRIKVSNSYLLLQMNGWLIKYKINSKKEYQIIEDSIIRLRGNFNITFCECDSLGKIYYCYEKEVIYYNGNIRVLINLNLSSGEIIEQRK